LGNWRAIFEQDKGDILVTGAADYQIFRGHGTQASASGLYFDLGTIAELQGNLSMAA
jgi:hypothetical protein